MHYYGLLTSINAICHLPTHCIPPKLGGILGVLASHRENIANLLIRLCAQVYQNHQVCCSGIDPWWTENAAGHICTLFTLLGFLVQLSRRGQKERWWFWGTSAATEEFQNKFHCLVNSEYIDDIFFNAHVNQNLFLRCTTGVYLHQLKKFANSLQSITGAGYEPAQDRNL